MVYNLEKVLYLANREELLHVSSKEKHNTDLSRIVQSSVDKGFLERVEDASTKDRFYKTTKAGEIRLLELKIQWRELNKKPTEKERERLSELLMDTTKYVPDYLAFCTVCGQTPVVTVEEHNKEISRTNMCGPCTWGNADTLDPDNW